VSLTGDDDDDDVTAQTMTSDTVDHVTVVTSDTGNHATYNVDAQALYLRRPSAVSQISLQNTFLIYLIVKLLSRKHSAWYRM